MENKMKYGLAIAICASELDNDKIPDEMKGLAIHKILSMETINAVNKDTLLNIVRYLFPLVFDVED